jgi:1-deoxy-D-xylulose-5-phosphate synthase
MSKLLESIEDPEDIRTLTVNQLELLADEIRELIIETISKNGGHLSSNLGVVELTLALHYCFDFKRDRLVWDVGHQGYTHKIITGRRESFHTLRQKDGISGYIDKNESEYDTFSFGHTGTSISAGLGLACGKEPGDRRKVVVVIGDGAIASGMPFEALNHAGESDTDLLVILNDNKMSISPSVGGIARHLSKIRTSASYLGIKKEAYDLIAHWHSALEKLDKLYGKISEGVQTALTPGGLFAEMGFNYYGPVDGHDLSEIIDTLNQLKRIDGPVLLHAITEKGKGFAPATTDPAGFHSSGRFTLQNGEIEPPEEKSDDTDSIRWSNAFGSSLLALARKDERIVAITAAMRDGTGLTEFSRQLPGRFYDVGICEQHAVGFAGGLAASGKRPVVCIYSTFLQRACDQIFHDISLQGAPVTFAIDRAGLVGNDGPTHHGLQDIGLFRMLPGFNVMAPADQEELMAMLELAINCGSPCAIRYAREDIPVLHDIPQKIEIGKADVMREGNDVAIIAYGAMVARALEAADILGGDGLDATIINARFAKPLDMPVIRETVESHKHILIAEDHYLAGGFGSAVLEELVSEGVDTSNLSLAAVPDRYIEHATRGQQLHALRLDGEGLANRIRECV